MTKKLWNHISFRKKLSSSRSCRHVEGNSKILRIFHLKTSERKLYFVAWKKFFPWKNPSWQIKFTFHSPVGNVRQSTELFCSPFNQTYHITFFPKKKTIFFNCSSGHVERYFDNPIRDPLPWFSNNFLSTCEELFIKSVSKKTPLFCLWTNRLFFWQPWGIFSAKIVKNFSLFVQKT